MNTLRRKKRVYHVPNAGRRMERRPHLCPQNASFGGLQDRNYTTTEEQTLVDTVTRVKPKAHRILRALQPERQPNPLSPDLRENARRAWIETSVRWTPWIAEKTPLVHFWVYVSDTLS